MNNGLPGPNTTETVTGGKTLELSKYDKIRKPHKMINDETKIKVTVRTLSTELCCPICLDLLTCTMTTKECLHRFCSECITTALMRGNKECPTCRKKIVSKRSLRPDPNFDFLISKIWPDRKLYDAELNASMQFFQEQSNVAALQKSIAEGIKAQAAYRKQRVQGSYDYEKRKRRPPKIVTDQNSSSATVFPACSSTENDGVNGHSSPVGSQRGSGGLVEQVVVNLTPVEAMEVDMPSSEIAHNQQTPIANAESSSSDETDASSDLGSDDSSDALSSDTTLSADLSSDELSNPSTVRSVVEESHQAPNELVRSRCVSSEECADLLILDSMADEMSRRGDEIEVELAPSKSLLAAGSIPAQMHCSHFVRAPSEITMEHIGEFLLQRSRQISDNSSKTNNGKTAGNQQQQLQPPQPLKLAPRHFYIVDRQYQLRKLSPRDTLCMAFLLSINWDRHLTIFFEVNGEEQTGPNMTAAIVGDELAKMVEEQRKADREEEERESHGKEGEKKSEKRETETSRGEMSSVKMEIQ